MNFQKGAIAFLLIVSLLFPNLAFAEDDLEVVVLHTVKCGEASFEISVTGGVGPYEILVDYGDGEDDEFEDIDTLPLILNHSYPTQGEFEYSIKMYDKEGLEGEAEADLEIAGPDVTLESDPSPPLLPYTPEGVAIDFTAIVSGGEAPYTFEWDLDADGNPDDGIDPASSTESFTYTESGKVKPSVKVTDACGFSDRDKLTVLIVDPSTEEDGEETEDPGEEEEGIKEENTGKGCHPVAQRIADVLNELSPERLEGAYECEDIFNFFSEDEGSGGHRFGLLQHAYHMTQIIDELTWEDIVDWHLEGSGWGVLQQLNKFAGALDQVGITDLVDRVVNGENTVGEIRNAVRVVLRYDADFEDALTRFEAGAAPGEINQLYKLAKELELDASELDEYQDAGIALSELKHASRLAGQIEGDWETVLQAYVDGYSWGEIRKASHMVDEDQDLEAILAIGLDSVREQEREERQAERRLEQVQRAAERLAHKYGVEEEEILTIYNEICDRSWGCVINQLREKAEDSRHSDRDQRTASRIAEKYRVSEDEVWGVFNGDCDGDWSCARTYFRNLTKEERGKGNK
jgi:hypothetical protein